MNTYADLAQAIRNAGYLSDADVEAAAAVLADALIVDEAKTIEAEAIVDKAVQKQNVMNAELLADEAVVAGDENTETAAQAMLDDSFVAVVEDKEIIEEMEAVIEAAYADAAAALVAAELLDEVNAEAVAALLAETWVAAEEDDEG